MAAFKVLKGARVEKGLSQEKLGEKLGMTKQTYCLKENGKAKFTWDEAQELSKILDKSLTYLFFKD